MSKAEFTGAESNKKVGRDYYIDDLDIADALDYVDTIEDTVKETLSEEEKTRGAEENITGLFNHLRNSLKGGGILTVPFSTIHRFIEKPHEYDPRQYKRLGILYFREDTTDWDFVNENGETIIPRGTQTIDLQIPKVNFEDSPAGTVVTPAMLTRSFELVADSIILNSMRGDFVVGLTHPRMGTIAARRWGFNIEGHPFPSELYRLFDLGLSDPINRMDAQMRESLEAYKNQVLVYQTKADFIKRATPSLREDR